MAWLGRPQIGDCINVDPRRTRVRGFGHHGFPARRRDQAPL